MAKTINLFTTIKGSLLEHFYPAGWDLRKMDRCCALGLVIIRIHARPPGRTIFTGTWSEALRQ